jgi:hypothetical protein
MTIAVIGAGTGRTANATSSLTCRSNKFPIRLDALKNLYEEGFEATIFEKASAIGGVWKFNPEPTVTLFLGSELGFR